MKIMRIPLFTLAAVLAAGGAFAADKPAKAPKDAALKKARSDNQLFDEQTKQRLRGSKRTLDEIKVQYEILAEQLKLDLAKKEAELKRLEMENKIADQARKAKLAELMRRIDDLDTRQKLAAAEAKLAGEEHKLDVVKLEAKHKAALASMQAAYNRLALENKLEAEKAKKAAAEKKRQIEQLKLSNDRKDQEIRRLDLSNAEEKKRIEIESLRLDFKSKKLKASKEEFQARLDDLERDLALRKKKAAWKTESNREPEYLPEPFKERKLVVTDRRIPLNGPIFRGVADYVTDRIHFFNNRSRELPIFIVIDRCPGGSVMEGYRILKAMEASKAPIHVVVKSYAYSMAAVITTLADRSYAYPNAIILHHEMSTVHWGNMTQIEEQLAISKQWEARLHVPVAKKMGMSLAKFRKEMYKHNSDGDWQEFADEAVKYKWVNRIVDEIRETGQIKHPDIAKKKRGALALVEQVDEKGNRYIKLPRLEPFDAYWIYNPDNYYR